MANPARQILHVAVAVTVIVFCAKAHADDAMIKYRQGVMSAIGGHTEALGSIFKGKVPFQDQTAMHIAAIDAMAKTGERLFPAESQKGETDALPVIWEKPEDFRKELAAFQKAAANLAAADEPAAQVAAFGEMVKTCKSCHDDFRKKR
jgi:cytochrome c556